MEIKPFSIYKSFGCYSFVFNTKTLSYTKGGLDISKYQKDTDIKPNKLVGEYSSVDEMLINMDSYLRKDIFYQVASLLINENNKDKVILSIIPYDNYANVSLIEINGKFSDPVTLKDNKDIQMWLFNKAIKNIELLKPESMREVNFYSSIELAALTDNIINYQSILRTL